MTHADKEHHHQKITGLHEAVQRTVTKRSLDAYWSTLHGVGIDDFNEAIRRAETAARVDRPPPGPGDLLALTQQARREREALRHPPPGTFRCNAHETNPDIVSANETCGWCDRCQFFVKAKRQQADLEWDAAHRRVSHG